MNTSSKVYFEFSFSASPSGGGNRFLTILKKMFDNEGKTSDSPDKADIIFYNSHQCASEVEKLKYQYGSTKVFVHRLDGLPRLYNNPNDERQDIAIKVNSLADKTIFQSQGSANQFAKVGLNPKSSTIIYNAADPSIFYPSKYIVRPKVVIVTSSWSPNKRKGFDYMRYLDNQLDFSRYEYIFIGNSPYEFRNIRSIGVLDSLQLASQLRVSDMFFTATENDTCSNSLIEALTCKLPVVAIRSGGNPELVKQGGELFDGESDVVKAIDRVSSNIEDYREKIDAPEIADVFRKYSEFIFG